jgi:hypothetical protein
VIPSLDRIGSEMDRDWISGVKKKKWEKVRVQWSMFENWNWIMLVISVLQFFRLEFRVLFIVSHSSSFLTIFFLFFIFSQVLLQYVLCGEILINLLNVWFVLWWVELKVEIIANSDKTMPFTMRRN